MKQYTYLMSLILIQFLSSWRLCAMEKKDSNGPEKSELEQHLKKFFRGKTKKKKIKQLKKSNSQAQTELATHFNNFNQGKTKKKHKQKPLKKVGKTPLQKKLEKVQLRKAVWENDTHQIKKLLKEGVNPNGINNITKNTTIHMAATVGNAEALCVLLAHPNSNPEATDTYRHTALFYAIKNNHPECVGLLLESKAGLGPARDKYTGFHEAVELKRLETVIALFTYCIHPKKSLVEVIKQKEKKEEEKSLVTSLSNLCIKQAIQHAQKTYHKGKKYKHYKIWQYIAKKIPFDTCDVLAQNMSFMQARYFVSCCPVKRQKDLAKHLAHYYAQEHIKNITFLLKLKSDTKGLPLTIAQAVNASDCIMALANPKICIAQLILVLSDIKDLNGFLKKKREKQDGLSLFSYIFTKRLLGKSWDFRYLKTE